MKILFFGDVIGSLGRKAVLKILPSWREKHAPDFVIANVENLAHGAGVTEKTLSELMAGGVDAFTGGNHSWDNPLGVPLLNDPEWQKRCLVPTNHGKAKGGKNFTVLERPGQQLGVLNLAGQLFGHENTIPPFGIFDQISAQHPDLPIVVDFHAEATSEKEAFGHYADSRAAAVFGTHTHVATADAKILPGGTAYITDIGRSGAHDSVIGFEKNSVIKHFLGHTDRHYEILEKGRAEVNAVLCELELDSRRAHRLIHLREILDI